MSRPAKPTPPYKDFPLQPHWNGRAWYWSKKIRGLKRYFGRCEAGWKEAVRLYESQREALQAGQDPDKFHGAVTVLAVIEDYLSHKLNLVHSKELRQRTYEDYKRTCELVANTFQDSRTVESLGPADFMELRGVLTKRFSGQRLTREIGQVRMIFRYAYESELIEKPLRFGPGFKPPSKKDKKRIQVLQGQTKKQLFTPGEIRTLIDAARPQIKAMVLLGINCAFEPHDCGQLTFDALDLEKGWHYFPRPKTGEERSCNLWPETVKALRDVKREPVVPTDLVFLTRPGGSWYKDSRDIPLSNEFRKLLDETKIYERGRTSFMTLRHTFQTIAEESTARQSTIGYIMGHVDATMAGVYREDISATRIASVASFVRDWVFGQPDEKGPQNRDRGI